MLLAAAFVQLSAWQTGTLLGATALLLLIAIVLAFDEGLVRGRAQGRALEREAIEHNRQQLRQEAWFPNRGRHD